MSEDNPASTAIRRCFNATEKEYKDAVKECDTYRDLCDELVQALNEICGVTDSPKAYKIALIAITKAEAILGDKNGR